jgi:hypothetical protein
MRPLAVAVCLAAVACLASSALAGEWITPQWPDGKEPRFEPVPWLWETISTCPVVYRTEVTVPAECDRVTVAIRTSGYVYVMVDGRQVYAWQPRREDRQRGRPAVAADPARVHTVDLTEAMGRQEMPEPRNPLSADKTPPPFDEPPATRFYAHQYTLTISAPAGGFVMDGGLYAGTKRLAPLATGKGWRVRKFPPATILADEPYVRNGYKGEALPVVAGEAWTADEDALAAAYAEALVARARRLLDDLRWELDLLTQKGIYIPLMKDDACGWGGPWRLDPKALRTADLLGWRAGPVSDAVEKLAAAGVRTVADLEKAALDVAAVRNGILFIRWNGQGPAWLAFSTDCSRSIALAKSEIMPNVEFPPQSAAPHYLHLADRINHPLNRLNESRYDRLGWINHPRLVDSDLGAWGVRVNPVTGPAKAAAPRRWLFSTDPKDTGVAELRWSIGYNIEGQWPTIETGKPWTADPRFKDYAGVAWYRARLHVPGEWAGNPVVLTVPAAGRVRLWVNDREAPAPAGGRCTLPPDQVRYGGENFIAVRIDAGPDDPRRGLVGTVEAACPALQGPAAAATPPVDVRATPLSPCAVLVPKTDTLQIHHAGTASLLLPPGKDAAGYDAARDGPLAANWALVSPGGQTRPVLLVFAAGPVRIACEAGLTRITLPQAVGRIIAVRPWVRADPPAAAARLEAIGLWSRAALAVPINYMEVTRVLKPGEPWADMAADRVPAGPVLGHTIVYDYLETKDAWGTEPLKLAPLPSLCSFGMDTKFRGLALDAGMKVETFQDGGLLAPYRGVRGADRVAYQYPVEPFPRLAGFTSWMFTGGDTGVRGNKRELEAVATTGANSYRPQHNFSDQPAPANQFPGDGRTRVQVIADYANAVGMNYMNNIDETLGGKPEDVTGDYAAFMERVSVHYEKIARQLTDRPAWAAAYDLVNEAYHHRHEAYNPAMRALIARVRAVDKRHLCYVEPCESWGAIQQLALIEPTGDPLTLHSFHDYNFRLKDAGDRWPNLRQDITSIYDMWLPVFVFAVRHGAGMHCGEFGGFHPPTFDSRAQRLMMNDFLRIFDQLGAHHHYYSGRELFESQTGGRRADGALRPSQVVYAYRQYFARGDFNLHYAPAGQPAWQGAPRPVAVDVPPAY